MRRAILSVCYERKSKKVKNQKQTFAHQMLITADRQLNTHDLINIRTLVLGHFFMINDI